mmetsp:Transcript_22087/g.51340  ORF Transcript_22087/g.51340 Transcript_22087/m.51340 type:complete len:118 (+) Transcript_22087:1072-1425(+)
MSTTNATHDECNAFLQYVQLHAHELGFPCSLPARQSDNGLLEYSLSTRKELARARHYLTALTGGIATFDKAFFPGGETSTARTQCTSADSPRASTPSTTTASSCATSASAASRGRTS